MDIQQIHQQLSQPFNLETWQAMLGKIFQGIEVFQTAIPIPLNDDKVESCAEIAKLKTADEQEVGYYCIQIKDGIQLERNKVGLRNLLRSIYKNDVDGAVIVFHQKSTTQWRLSFVSEINKLNEQEESIEKSTPSKRFTYLLGENVQVRTPAENLSSLIGKPINLQDILNAFSVEALNKEFYNKLYNWFQKTTKEVIFPNDLKQENHKQISLIRLLTRLLFVWFLKEKNLINLDFFDQKEVKKIIDYTKPSSYYKAILQNLFFATLNREINARSFRTTDKQGKPNSNNYLVPIYRYQNLFLDQNKENIIALFKQTPFLNGGLFECLDRKATSEEEEAYDKDKTSRSIRSAIRLEGFSDREDNQLKFANTLFFNEDENQLGLISLLNQYKFTIEESTPLDIEVALDPELLGKVFENLLASYNPETGEQARKATGSFYTPREIVHYMVDESLKQHIRQQTDWSNDTIAKLFTVHQDSCELTKQQIQQLISLINNIKIIDPAVGSGAFSMGMLNRLIDILHLIDPNNQYFKQQQIDSANKMTDEESKQASIEKIENIFSTQNQHNNYGKKLHLIENAIYGVDIQPIAIQICKLRFFISLVIEQQTNRNEKDNYGIKALPNLETKFVIADSLLPLQTSSKTEDQGFFDNDIKDLRTQLDNIRHRYFNAKTRKTKQKHQEEDKKARQQLKDKIEKSEYDAFTSPELTQMMQKVIDWDLYNPDVIADWFSPKWMFGVDAFDIVIGNPPYIQLQKEGGKLGKRYKKCQYDAFASTGDIYTLFYERGYQLLNDDGHLCLITSNKWMRAGYGAKIRQFFTQKIQPIQLIDMGPGVFENATVDTNILLLNKTQQVSKKTMKAITLKEKQQQSLENLPFINLPIPQADESWVILNPIEQSIKEKIERIGTPLKEWDVQINYGIKTGYNDAFIIDGKKKDELIKQDPKSAEIIRPILRGKDIKRYSHQFADLYLIATFPSLKINIENYPMVKQHLLSFGKKRLEQSGAKGARKKTNNKWFETQDSIGYWEDFSKQKIVYPNMTKHLPFMYDDAGFITNQKCFVVVGLYLKYLTSFLNSNVSCYWIKSNCPELQGGTRELSKIFLKLLPVPKVSFSQREIFEIMVDKILIKKNKNDNTLKEENQIDKLIYNLYGFTREEIKFIERV